LSGNAQKRVCGWPLESLQLLKNPIAGIGRGGKGRKGKKRIRK